MNIQPSKLNQTSASEPVAVDEGSAPDVAAIDFRQWRYNHLAVSSARGAILFRKRTGRLLGSGERRDGEIPGLDGLALELLHRIGEPGKGSTSDFRGD